MDIVVVRNNAGNRYFRPLLQPLKTGFEQGEITAELVDDEGSDEIPLFRLQEFQSSNQRSEHPASVDIRRQEDRRPAVERHTHVDDVSVLEIDLSGTAGSLDQDYIVLCRELLQRLGDDRSQPLSQRVVVFRRQSP